ncbi:MAG: hypothetical protein ACOVS5_12330 [Oligoflexus sp.]|jgi:hypothetical protein
MVLKIFGKSVGEGTPAQETDSQNERIAKLEGHLNDLGAEVVRLRSEVNTLLARQGSFRVALKRLRVYLEERGAQDEVAQEVSAPFQDLALEEEGASEHAVRVKNKDHLN